MSTEFTDSTHQLKSFLAGVFDRVSQAYDQTGPGFFAYYGERLVDWAEIQLGESVLDLATGTGAVLVPAAKAVGKQGSIEGIDLSEKMIESVQRTVQDLGWDQVRLHVGDAERLAFPEETFDVLLSGFGLFFFSPHSRVTGRYFSCTQTGRPAGLFHLGSRA